MRALTREIQTWRALVDAHGVLPRPSVLVRIETSRASIYVEGSTAIEELAQFLYQEACDKPLTARAKG